MSVIFFFTISFLDLAGLKLAFLMHCTSETRFWSYLLSNYKFNEKSRFAVFCHKWCMSEKKFSNQLSNFSTFCGKINYQDNSAPKYKCNAGFSLVSLEFTKKCPFFWPRRIYYLRKMREQQNLVVNQYVQSLWGCCRWIMDLAPRAAKIGIESLSC